MCKAFLFGVALTIMVTSLVIIAPNSSRQAFAAEGFAVAEDSVFLDEGDGDFAAPPAPTAQAPQVAADDKGETEDGAKEEKPKALPLKNVKRSPKTKIAATPSSAKGKFAQTHKECPLLREPASESEEMIKVRAAKKIWVEEVDGSWVRAFNKAGEPGYVSTECFE